MQIKKRFESVKKYGGFQSRYLMDSIVRNIPGEIGIRVRAIYYPSRLKECGDSIHILENSYIDFPERISVGNRVVISRFCSLSGWFGIEIGNDVIIGPYSMLESVEHVHSKREMPIADQGSEGNPIKIEDDVWIGAGVMILDGITIKKGSIIGAGAVVTRDIDQFEIVGGVPAKHISWR